ncbi:unnamed protein product [Arctia plantaginis]|uniref:Smr domain-containing protein n=1 Tax=Arctia plantaginis TaxID=874455 RepID=A0A8S0Z3S9_ARCPL|nr:unnamed protein product [Arctia plantaginis]
MEPQRDEDSDYNSVIDSLVNMFSPFVSKEVITTLVESFEGDLNLCVDAITEITNNGNMIPNDDQPSTSQSTQPNTTLQQTQPTISYARTAQSTGAVVKEPQTKEKRNVEPSRYFWTDQIRKIITHYNNGSRIMIIMRGLPGSGKSHLARLIVETLIGPSLSSYNNHVFSSDDYFMVRGKYQYDKSYISYAHSWNQNRVETSAIQGLSPIIIDNTNIEIWEMRPYVVQGLMNGYIIEVVEPMTPWAKIPRQLFNMNTHKVPLQKIKRMLDNYVENVTGESLIHSFRLSYAEDMVPPIKRLIPAIPPILADNKSDLKSNSEATTSSEVGPSLLLQDEARNHLLQPPKQSYQNSHEQTKNVEDSGQDRLKPSAENLFHEEEDNIEFITMSDVNDLSEEEQAKQKIVLEAQKKLEELQKFEEDWDNGEKWDENDTEGDTSFIKFDKTTSTTSTVTATNSSTSSPINVTTALISSLESKPPREKPVKDSNTETTSNGLMLSVTDCQDWRYISLFMPPWNHPDEEQTIAPPEEIPKEKKDTSTCVEINDINLSGNYKVISTMSRDINELYVPPVQEKIPEKRMLDKSTMTNEGIIMTVQCPQKERHFIAFRNLFKHIERESLRYIFDNCCGDVNWAVENILGGVSEYKVKSEDGVGSDLEELLDPGSDLPCTCLGKYEIMPNNVSKTDVTPSISDDKVTELSTESSVVQLEKKKRVITVSEENMQLKRQIEQTVVIADNHYSEHCLKIRKIRRGEYNKVENDFEQPSTSGTSSTAFVNVASNRTASNSDSSDYDDSSSNTSNISESDKIVNINLGRSFIQKLDEMFGRENMEYPSNINFNISIPTSLLNQINALWIESMMYQLDDNAKRSALMLKQDEEFARQLQLKEKELMLEGKEPDVPDFKEIMDLEFALNLHMRDISEWRNNIPTDLAAKMTHEKLFNLFPEVKNDTLLEMLVAHGNNFKATVEVLLISLGREEILESENGLNKFVMEKELQRHEKLLEEHKKALSETEWPLLVKGDKIDISTVQHYRDDAEKHLTRRNMQMKKAEDYIQRGMTQVANYCSEIANFHKNQYELSSSKAVASLIQYHAENNPNNETVDLHFFRVKEAMEAMDLFIDRHIQRLRDLNLRSVTLFFITGRGLHSPGRPKVKPACIKRLRERGLHHSECNPGLLRSRVSYNSKLTYQIT